MWTTFESHNLKSAFEKPHIVLAKLNKLNKEREAGRIAGPFTVPPYLIFDCSPQALKDPSEVRNHTLTYHTLTVPLPMILFPLIVLRSDMLP